jgi:hypothetical protein
VTYRSIAGEVVARPSSRASAGSRDLAWFVLLVAMAHAITYFLVGALGLALSPFLLLLRRWSVWQRTIAVAGLYLVIGSGRQP